METSFLQRLFAVFPGCKASGWRRAAGPWAGGSVTSNLQGYTFLLRMGSGVLRSKALTLKPQRDIVRQISQAIAATGCRANGPAGG